MQHQKKMLVTGGTGFIGRRVVARALSIGWKVTSLSLRPPLQPGGKNLIQIAADLADPKAVGEALAGQQYDYVVNCAGYIDHRLFFTGGRGILETHFYGIINLIEAIHHDSLCAFINIGSSDEYGDAPAPQSEVQREHPISPYSLGKVSATHLLQTLYRSEKFPATTLRLFLTYGPGQDDKRFLPQIIQAALENRSFPASQGEQLRDFCFVDDTVDAIFLALDSLAARGEVINIGSGEPRSIRDVIEAVSRIAGGGRPRFGEIAYRPAENMALYADITKARELLGWRPTISFVDGLNKTIQWMHNRT